jgi:hypothetical protein
LFRRFFRARIVLFGLLLTLGGGAWLSFGDRPPGTQDEGVSVEERFASLLLAEEGLHLVPGSLVVPELPPAGGFGPLSWRAILFAATPEPVAGASAPPMAAPVGADLFRAEIRHDAHALPVGLRRVANLTRTTGADERLLLAAGRWSLWGIRVAELDQALLLVDPAADERELDEEASSRQRWMVRITSRLGTGSWSGVGLSTFNLLVPATGLDARWEEAPAGRPAFAVSLYRGRAEVDAQVVIDPVDRSVLAGTGEVALRPREYADTPLVHWLVDTVRSLPWVGPRPITLLEKWVFTVRNEATGLGHRLGLLSRDRLVDQLGLVPAQVASAEVALAGPRAEEGSEWPPPPVPPLVSRPQPGEGQWYPWQPPWLRTVPGAPPAFYKTALTLPGKIPALAVLVAMDLRQLELEMIAGLDTPWSRTGAQGAGRIPRQPETLARAVAAFNGGFQTAHGAFGMMVHRELILDPLEKTATIATLQDGTIVMGTWNNSIAVPESIDSFRQNMPPLLEDGVWNPMNVPRWGVTVHDLDQVHTTRSAIGQRGDSTLIYLWSDMISAKGSAEALRQAGCGYAVHLDINPEQAGFALLFLDESSLTARGAIRRFELEAPSRAQTFNLHRFVNRNGKDFFAMLLRRGLPDWLPAPPPGYSPWQPELRPELPDPFLPVAATSQAVDGELLVALDLRRLGGLLSLGTQDARLLPTAAAASPAKLTLNQPLALLTLGAVDPERPLGLVVDGQTVVPPAPTFAALVLDAAGRLDLLPAAAADAATSSPGLRQAIPLLVGGELTARGAAALQAGAGRRHHYLGRLDGVRPLLVYGTSRRDPASLAGVLQSLGVAEALLLADGEESRLHWLAAGSAASVAGAEAPPDSGGIVVRSPLGGPPRALSLEDFPETRVLLDALPEPPRTARLRLADVELTPEQIASTRRIQEIIASKRAELMEVVVERYRENRARAAREAAEAAEAAAPGSPP